MSDLQELFSRNPLKNSDKDVDEVIKEMRGMRHLFNAGNLKAGSTKPKPIKDKAVSDLASRMDLKDINL